MQQGLTSGRRLILVMMMTSRRDPSLIDTKGSSEEVHVAHCGPSDGRRPNDDE